ncbi:MAG: sugar phosphate isomerase/epimerase [Candidatus Brocadiaceae bacterium]|mgnify:CR=1 FL=1|nr:sugar phosphate isomerase/epimerase [Candidatus Brocadiaceae bacterium]
MKDTPVGIQLYSVRGDCEKDFAGTLKALADMGYDGVEFAWNYGSMPPDELADLLRSLGLRACGLHAPKDQIAAPDSQAYAYAAGVGCPYISVSLAGDVEKDWPAAIALVQEAGRVAAGKGILFSYHNHAQEFHTFDGKYALDALYEQTDPTQVMAELDTHWIARGGADPVAYIRKYAGRVPQLHLKDIGPNDEFIEIGRGVLDLEAVLNAADDAGSKWIIYEQDRCERPALESARISIDNLHKVLG